MSPPIVVAAIVPAAGRSARMGRPKQLLPVGDRPMLLGVLDALLGGGVARVTVVVNPALRAQLPRLGPRIQVIVNDQPKSAMIDSVRIGTSAVGEVDGYLVCPGDAARLAATDVCRCIQAFAETPDRIVIATHAGRRGHPMVFPASLADAVRSAECDGGLNQLARNRPGLVREVACHSPGTTANVNTPADYRKFR